MKKFLKIILLTIVLAFSLNTFVHADGADSVVVEENVASFESQENVGVSTIPPKEETAEGITPFGVTKPPSSSTWNLSTKGRYDFSGIAGGSTLYTSYLLHGKSRVKILVTNYYSKTLKVSFKKSVLLLDPTEWSYQLQPGASVTAWIPTVSSDKYYLVFNAPSDFSGYIE